jgi:VanZ family protein
MVGIYYLSSRPSVAVPGSDKLLHFLAYGVLALLLLYGLAPRLPYWRAWWPSLAISALYGASDEWHQSHVPGRNPEVADAVADAAGALTFLLAAGAMRAALQRTLRRNARG